MGRGFYKLEDILYYAPNGVSNLEYELVAQLYETYTYPIDGWYWFDSEEEARRFFNL